VRARRCRIREVSTRDAMISCGRWRPRLPIRRPRPVGEHQPRRVLP
jgi:hypothetical protein